MSSSKWKSARLVSLALLLFFSPVVFGLGLGNVKVESFLNQPLNARIDLLVRPGEDISGVTARLASAEDYALIGASRDAISVPLRFTVDTQSEQPFVRVTSTLPVNQPVVRLIVELNWASGRLLREYTLFLDPPVIPAAAPPPVVDERRAAPASAASTAPDTAAEDSDAPTEPMADEGTAASDTQISSDSEYGPVKTGDTLWKIASNWSAGSGASVNQVMVAIQRNNPSAFINNNINLLKRGAILRMPSAAEIAAIPAAEATAEVREQGELFASGAASNPAAAAPAPAVETPLVDVASDMSSAGPAENAGDDGPKLEIVPPSAESSADSAYGDEDSPEASSASTSLVALQEELARQEEALITEQQTNEYLQQRIKELESQSTETGDASLVVEDEELAGMESQLREERLDAAEDTAGSTEVQATAAAAPEAPWYQRGIIWLIAVLVLLAAAIGWFFSRRNKAAIEIDLGTANERTVRELKDEAETILKVLEPAGEDKPSGQQVDEAGDDDKTGQEDEPGPAGDAVATPRFGQARQVHHEEARVLDEDSADPEVRLDLARAYISMGDREAARAILGEVIEHGDEAQKSEAQSMLDAM